MVQIDRNPIPVAFNDLVKSKTHRTNVDFVTPVSSRIGCPPYPSQDVNRTFATPNLRRAIPIQRFIQLRSRSFEKPTTAQAKHTQYLHPTMPTKTFVEYDLKSCINMATSWQSKTEKSIVETRSDLSLFSRRRAS